MPDRQGKERLNENREHFPFQEEDITIHAVYSDGRIRRVCRHVATFDEKDPAIVAILGSEDCYKKWLAKQPKEATSVH
jgi:hypothetical protein